MLHEFGFVVSLWDVTVFGRFVRAWISQLYETMGWYALPLWGVVSLIGAGGG